MTDWGAASDRVAGLAAGLDLERPGSRKAFDPEILAAVAEGRLDEAAVDRCATRVVELLQRGARSDAAPAPDLKVEGPPDPAARADWAAVERDFADRKRRGLTASCGTEHGFLLSLIHI